MNNLNISNSGREWPKSNVRIYNLERAAGNKLPCNSLHDFFMSLLSMWTLSRIDFV